MAERTFKPKPLVDSNLVTEFGGVEMTPEFMDDGPGHHNYLYVPGASDRRYERDCKLSELFRGEIKGKDVPALTHNARWFRTVKGAGSDPDNTRSVYGKNQGYEPAMWDQIGNVPWLTAAPPGAVKAPDGTIRSSGGDLTLMVASQEVAARNAMKKKIRTEESVDGMEFQSGGLGTIKIPGADPYVEKTIGQEAIK